jgi:hypothetical protein
MRKGWWTMKHIAFVLLMIFTTRVNAAPKIPWKEIALGAGIVGADVADIETTQYCLARHTCQELNPLAPIRRVRVYPVSLSFDLTAIIYAHHMRDTGHKFWWLESVGLGSIHSGAALFNHFNQ